MNRGAWHGSQTLKDECVARVRDLIEADELERGVDHGRYPIEFGIPEWAGRVQKVIFERLPLADAHPFAFDFLMVIEPGADIEKVRVPWLVALLRRNLGCVVDDDLHAVECRDAIRSVIDALKSGDAESIELARRVALLAQESAWDACRFNSSWSARMAVQVVTVEGVGLVCAAARAVADLTFWMASSGDDFLAQRDDFLRLLRGCPMVGA